MYTHDTVTLHSGPGDRFGTVTRTLGAGEQITVLWCNSAGWCRVQSNLFEGWAPMAELIPITGLGAGGVVLNGTSQAPAGDPNISAIIAASPDESANSLSASDGTADAASASTGGAGIIGFLWRQFALEPEGPLSRSWPTCGRLGDVLTRVSYTRRTWMTSGRRVPRTILLAIAATILCGTLAAPAEAQLIRRSRDGNTLLIDPILCQTDYQVRQAIAAQGFTHIFLNAPIDDRIRARATKGKTVYQIDYNRCRGRFIGVQPLRPAN